MLKNTATLVGVLGLLLLATARVEAQDGCACSPDGVSGGVNTGRPGCAAHLNDTYGEDRPFCYIQDTALYCPEAMPSSTFPPATYRFCDDEIMEVMDGSRRILALHGGGQTADGFRAMQGVQDLMASLPTYEFVFASTPETGNLWIRDPPGGKGQPTLTRDWAENSISYLNQLVEREGPFWGIMGYSQGGAMIPIYLANTNNTFERVILYNAYLPSTHQGLMETIDESELTELALVFSGEFDEGFKDMAVDLAQVFLNSTEIRSPTAGHNPPPQSDQTYQEILSFITSD